MDQIYLIKSVLECQSMLWTLSKTCDVLKTSRNLFFINLLDMNIMCNAELLTHLKLYNHKLIYQTEVTSVKKISQFNKRFFIKSSDFGRQNSKLKFLHVEHKVAISIRRTYTTSI